MSFIAGLLFFVVFILLFGVMLVFALLRHGLGLLRRLFFPGSTQSFHSAQDNRSSSNTHTKTYQTRDGVTITDHRNPEDSKKKIFAPNEGEYVEFSEE